MMCSYCPLGCVATTLHTRTILTALRSKMTLLLFAMKGDATDASAERDGTSACWLSLKQS